MSIHHLNLQKHATEKNNLSTSPVRDYLNSEIILVHIYVINQTLDEHSYTPYIKGHTSLRSLGPIIWNIILDNITAVSLISFK